MAKFESPKKINLIELGAGNGEMMKILIESFKNFPFFLSSCKFIIYEKSPKLILEQKKQLKDLKISWIKKLKRINKDPTIFIANEFFDAHAIKQFIKRNSYGMKNLFISMIKIMLIYSKKNRYKKT